MAAQMEAPGDAVAAAAQAQITEHEHRDSAATADAMRKHFASAQAQAALKGWRLDKMHGISGRAVYVLSRWGRAIDCADLDAVRVVLARMGVQS